MTARVTVFPRDRKLPSSYVRWSVHRVWGAVVTGLLVWLGVSVLVFPSVERALACAELDARWPGYLVMLTTTPRISGPFLSEWLAQAQPGGDDPEHFIALLHRCH